MSFVHLTNAGAKTDGDSIVAFPAIFAFGVVPCFHAQIMHIFTNRLTYTVSFKPAVAARIPPTEERKQSLA